MDSPSQFSSIKVFEEGFVYNSMSIHHQGMHSVPRYLKSGSGNGKRVYTIRVFEEGHVYGYEYTASGYVYQVI